MVEVTLPRWMNSLIFWICGLKLRFVPSLTSPHFVLFLLVSVAKAFAKGAVASVPVATLAAPVFAMDSIVDALPTTSLSLEVQFGAYLAVLLGTFLPCLFLINLYIQTETRKAGAEDALKDEF
jgi:photosystem II reaction center protein PsbM